MRVLMFGWEFPPHISGGLGTACYGLTRGLSNFKDIEVLFVVPKSYGDENQSTIKLIGAGDIPIAKKQIMFADTQQKVNYYEVNSHIIPYTDPDEFWKLTSAHFSSKTQFVETDNQGRIVFTGSYGKNLINEIYNYAIVAVTIANDNEFDIIHAHDWLTYPAGIAAKKASGKPLVIHVHATDFDRSGGSVNPKVYAIEREGMEAADKIIAVSNFTRDTIIEKFNINPNKVETVYNAVEPVKHPDKLTLKKGFNEKIVTYLGRITMQKGPEYFIEAAYQVLLRTRDVRFVMAGSGDMMNAMIRKAAKLGITDYFHFTGFLHGNDVFQLLKISDVYVMPSVSEPFGISTLEAVQSDVPVIISKHSGVSEILTHAIKIDFWDINAIADAIHAIIEYPALSQTLNKHARTEVNSLQWKESAKNVRSIYQTILNTL